MVTLIIRHEFPSISLNAVRSLLRDVTQGDHIAPHASTRTGLPNANMKPASLRPTPNPCTGAVSVPQVQWIRTDAGLSEK